MQKKIKKNANTQGFMSSLFKNSLELDVNKQGMWRPCFAAGLKWRRLFYLFEISAIAKQKVLVTYNYINEN